MPRRGLLTWWRDRRFIAQHKRRVSKAPSDVRAAHGHCSDHRAEVLASRRCGCFYCGGIFPPSEIKDWIDPIGEEGKTALCAKCGIDSVIGDRSGFPITPEFLERMNRYWF
jgi:hypothetical protein